MEMKFEGEDWQVYLYESGTDISDVQGQPIVGCDTEYEMKKEGEPYKTALLQMAFPNGICYLVKYKEIQEFIHKICDINPDMVWIFFNAPTDLWALEYWNNPLKDKIFDKNNYVIQDMMIRYPLYEISAGEFYAIQSLAFYVQKYLGIKISKDEDIRLTYTQGMTLTADHAKYGAQDAIVTLKLGQLISPQPMEQIKSLGFLALKDMTERGYPADTDHLEKMRKKETDILHNKLEYLTTWGVWPASVAGEPTGISGGKKEFHSILRSLETQLNIQFPRTEAGSKDPSKDTISTENDDPELPFIKNNLPVHSLIKEYKAFKHAEKMLSTYLKDTHLRSDGKWHPSYSPIKATGRTGAKDPPIQTFPQKGGHRGIFCAEPGYVILVIDVDQAELCALAQSCYKRFGFSRMMELINEGYDLHQYYAENSIIKAIHGKNIEDYTKEELKQFRQQAKPINFGYPGGLGVSTFVVYARNSWNQNFSRDFAQQSKELWLETFPECKLHLKPTPDEAFWLHNIQKELKKHNVPLRLIDSIPHAEAVLREEGWLEDEISDLKFKTSAYRVKTVHGRIKRNCTYTAACNYEFQAAVADAMSYCKAKCMEKGLSQIAFVHDELHFYLKRDKHLQDNIKLCEDTMRSSIQEMFPDVKIGVESALMSRWYKEAKPIYDDAGNLLEWSPGFQEN